MPAERKEAVEWLDAKTHRDPKWPVGGYAPGGYMGRCLRCEGQFLNMDKRANLCFPCAVEAIQTACEEYRVKLRDVTAERDTLAAAIRIARPLEGEQ